MDRYKELSWFLTSKKDGNFADYVGDDPDSLERRRKRFAGSQKIVLLKQVHGNTVLKIDSTKIEPNGAFYFGGEGDGMITNEEGLILAVQSADCAGVLLYDKTNRAIAALHAGRKGAELNILGKCVAKMRDLYGTNPSGLVMYVGAHIRGCCYELPYGIAKEFEKYENAVEKRGSKYYLDIAKVILSQARSLGIRDENIEINPSCTSCESDKYFSYRAQGGRCGRMLTAIGLKAI